MIERTESVVEQRTVTLASSDGLSATISDDGMRVDVSCSTIEGQSTLRVNSGLVGVLVNLAAAIAADPTLVIPPPEPEPSTSTGDS